MRRSPGGVVAGSHPLKPPGVLERLERIVDDSGVAENVESLLPRGARNRQLSVRTLFVGMLLSQQDGRPAHLTRVHKALAGL
ncbi:MAG: hypothetical protein ACRDIU_03185, partial [Actinomycetota bacterium]